MSTIYIQLGRTGDILSLLPLLWKGDAEGQRAKLMVAEEYASVLEGVSYVDAVPFEGAHHEIARACAEARALADKVVCVQVNGPKGQVYEHTYRPAGMDGARTTSFVKEMWKLAGKLPLWDSVPPLLFDQRSPEREANLLAAYRAKKEKPLLLLSTVGNSSPFPYQPLLVKLVRLAFGQTHQIVELPHAERIYDLLALYERAHCLIATDSAPLHLARACPELPVMALTNDQPALWNGSAWEPNWFWSCRYGDFPARAPELLRAVEVCRNKAPSRIIRVWNAYEPTEEKIKPGRNLPVYRGACGRDAASTMADPKRVPYLRDCLRMGLQRAGALDWVALSRPDTQLEAHAEAELTRHEAAYAYRMEERDGMKTVGPMVDLFCATKAWWRVHLEEIPDLLLGRDHFWSRALWSIFRKHGAQDVSGVCFRSPAAPRPVLPPEPPRMTHNRKLSAEALIKSGVKSTYPTLSEQAQVLPLDTSALPPFAYNPSLIKIGAKVLLSYRYHFAGDPRTRLGLAEIVEGRAVNPQDLPIEGVSVEDARLFRFHGGLWISWVASDFIGQADPKAVVRYASLGWEFVADDKPAQLKLGRIYQAKSGANDWSAIQKNWCFFEARECLFAAYLTYPEHTVLQIQGDEVINQYKTPALRWPYGSIRGGNVVPYGDKLLRFFHSRTDKGLAGLEPRYYVGAALMESWLPFKVLKVSAKPILFGAELPRFKCHHFKPNVIFPCGAIAEGEDFILAVGVNDSACALVKVSPTQLHL